MVVMTDAEPFTPSRALVATLAGLAVGVLGLLVQWIAAPQLFGSFGFPPGIIYVVAAGVIVWLDRRSTWSPSAAVALALWIVIGGLAGGNLTENLASGDVGIIAGNLVMVLGLLVAAVAGVLAIRHNRRHPGQRQPKPLDGANPHRGATLVTVLALVAVAIGDGAPEGLNWDGPGPVLFLALAVAVALVPGRTMLLLSMLMCVAFIAGWFGSSEVAQKLAAPADWFPFACTLLQILGLFTGLVAGAFAALPARRARRGYSRSV